MFKAIIITPNERTGDVGSLLAVSRAEACRREHTSVNPPVRALVFVAELGVYVAVYEVPVDSKSVNEISAIRKIDNEKVDGKKLSKGVF